MRFVFSFLVLFCCLLYNPFLYAQEEKIEEIFCAQNSDCDVLGKGRYFCNYDGLADCVLETHNKIGWCDRADIYDLVTEEKNGFSGIISDDPIDWFSARNFCEANGKQMVSFKDFGTDKAQLGKYFKEHGMCVGNKCEGLNWKKYKGTLVSKTVWVTEYASEFLFCKAYQIYFQQHTIDCSFRDTGYSFALCK